MNDDVEPVTRCVACEQPVDYCQGGHGEPCEDCRGYADAHEADCTWVHHLPWVDVMYGDARELYREALENYGSPEMAEDWDGTISHMDWDLLVTRMRDWDMGAETDAAHTYVLDEATVQVANANLRDVYEYEGQPAPWGRSEDEYVYGQYVLVINWHLSSAALYRRGKEEVQHAGR